jgi:hypothetical protein
MATDKLYSILLFTAVPVGNTQTLPHGLVLRNVPVTPDFVELQYQDTFEFVSADAVNLTIRNTANPGGNCEAWVTAIHPSFRLLGLQPDDGLMSQGLVPRPFCPGSPNVPAAGAGGTYVVVFRPGGVAGENVVVTWADALARLALLQGQRILQFDDSVVTPIVIPVGGPYDMTGVTWSTVPDRIVEVRIPEGASFTHLRSFLDRIHVRFTGTTPPIADFGQAPPQIDTVTIDGFAELSSSGAGPLMDVGANAQFLLGDQAGLFFVGHAVVNISAAVTVAFILEGEEATVAADTISGIVGSTVDLIWANSALLVSTSQTTFLGTLTPINTSRTFNFPSDILVINTALGTDAPTQLVLVDPTGGAFTVTLPSAGPSLRGQTIRLKNVAVSVNNVTLAADLGDNIDGNPSVVLSGDHFHFAVTSDGVNTWYVTG